jgi:hypothetical protein
MLAGYPALLFQSVALVACHDNGVGDSGGGAMSRSAVSVDVIKQHVVSKGWGDYFSCKVDSGTLVVGDWVLHLLRPFGTSARVL